MTMYLPNPHVRPTGAEAAEFIGEVIDPKHPGEPRHRTAIDESRPTDLIDANGEATL
jgi:hypothetical protein